MGAALAVNAGRLNQLEVRFVDQSRRLKGVIRVSPEVLSRNAPQLRIDQRYELIKGFRIAIAPCSNQAAEVPLTFEVQLG